MEIEEYMSLKKYTTFRMGPQARYFGVVHTLEELQEGYEFASQNNLNVFILGSGSNIIFSQLKTIEALVLKIELKGIEIVSDNGEELILKVGAGEIWDDVVQFAVAKNLYGIEAMSWIPGTAGATPIQNVGAYGSEIGDVLISLEALEISSGQIKQFTNKDCKFKYRDSVFKHEAKDGYVITSITIKLSRTQSALPDYPGVKSYFEKLEIKNPTIGQVRQAIIDIRTIKLPDPKQLASVGSFFKNPIVSEPVHNSLKEKYPDMISFQLDNGNYKIGAGWLLEKAGLKGKQFGNLQFYPNNALVIVNTNDASFSELNSLVGETKSKIKTTFGIDLEIEPIII